MTKPVRMGIEIEYLMMTHDGGPIYSGWKQQDISKFRGLQILRDAAQSLQYGIERKTDAAGHRNVYTFRDEKIMIPDTYTLLETVTAPLMSLDYLRDQLWSMKNALIKAAARHERSLVSGAACPIAYRYEDLARRGSITANNAGMHVHIEAPNDKIKIKLCNMIMQVMPELTALGVNSPIYNRKPSGFRSKRLDTSPLVGPSGVSPMEYEPDNPLQFDSPRDRYRYLTPYTKNKRTIELRGFDTPMTIDWAMAIAALIQCLAAKASRLFVNEQRNTVVGNSSKLRKSNFNAAKRLGLSATFHPDHSFHVKLDGKRHHLSFLYHNKDIEKNTKIPATIAVKRLLYYIEAEAYQLGLTQYLHPLYSAARTGEDQAQQQLDWFRRYGYVGFFERLRMESAKAPQNRSTIEGNTRQYFTVRQKAKNMAENKVYVSAAGLRNLRSFDGSFLIISGPLCSVRVQVAHDRSYTGTIPLSHDEIRLGRKLRNRLGVSMYDPVIIGRESVTPIVVEKAGKKWIPHS